MGNFDGSFTYPSNVFWGIASLPFLSHFVCLIFSLYTGQNLITDPIILPFNANNIPERYIIGSVSFFVSILMCIATYRLYHYFTTGHRQVALNSHSFSGTICVALFILGIAAAIGYSAVAFFTTTESGIKTHSYIEFAFFTVLIFFYLFCQYLFKITSLKSPFNFQLILQNVVIFVLYVVYFGSFFIAFRKNVDIIPRIIQVSGYLLYLVGFSLYPVFFRLYTPLKGNLKKY